MALVLPDNSGNEQRTILIDCVSNPVVRLKQANISLDAITDMILTHFHPDHVSGAPLLLMNAWLLGRKKPLTIYGIEHTLDRFQKLMGFYDWDRWPDFFECVFKTIPTSEMWTLITEDQLKIFASPVHHIIPTIGLRIEMGEKVLAYSCDTEPCDEVVRLARGADILIHEATGATFGHSSASQAGEIARRAGVKQLYLIHYHAAEKNSDHLVADALTTFGGPTALAKDFMVIPLE